MFKPFSLIFFIVVFAWIVQIFLTTDGSERIERACSPVEVFGKVAISGTALVADQFTPVMQDSMNKWVYGCRYIVWRSVYEEDYLQYVNQVEAEKAMTSSEDGARQSGTAPAGAKAANSTSHPKNATRAQ